MLKPAAQPNNPSDPERTMRRWTTRKVFTIIDNPLSPDGKIDRNDPPIEFSVANAAKLREYLGITTRGERILEFIRFDSDVPVALGTAQGTVKRFVPSTLPVRPHPRSHCPSATRRVQAVPTVQS